MPSENSQRPARTVRYSIAALLLLPLAGCLNVVDTKDQFNRYGAVTIRGTGRAGTGVAATANAAFFRALSASVPDSRMVQNSCQFAAVDTTTPVARGDLRAGSSVGLLVGANSNKQPLSLAFSSTNTSYLLGSSFTYQAGDSAIIAVPGEDGGYPAANIAVRLAEPIVPQDITIPAPNAPMVVRWNVGDSTSAVILSIRYANPTNSSYANEQVICTLVDDGAEDVPASAMGPFLNSPAGMRSVRITRWRTQIANPGERSLVHLVTTTDSTAILK